MSGPAISAKGVSKQFRLGEGRGHDSLRDAIAGLFSRSQENRSGSGESFWALDDVSFDIQPGEVVGFVGHNGAGKSTLLKILSRITDPTRGVIDIYGRVASLLEVGTGFHPDLSGRENIFLNGSVLGMRRAEISAKLDAIVDFSGVERFLDMPVKHYSSGMQVRLAFAVAAHLEPEILIIDEVLAVGDAEFQRKCLGKMDDVARSGRTVLFVSHNLDAVNLLCSRAVMLQAGRLVVDGPVKQVLATYLSSLSLNAQAAKSIHGPDSEDVALMSVAASCAGTETAQIDNGRDIDIVARLDIRRPGAYSICVGLKRHGQQCFLANSFHQPSLLDVALPGVEDVTVTIPKYLLNPGHHDIDVYVARMGETRTLLVKAEAVRSFHVADDGVRRGGLFTGEWPGAVSPLLQFARTSGSADRPG